MITPKIQFRRKLGNLFQTAFGASKARGGAGFFYGYGATQSQATTQARARYASKMIKLIAQRRAAI